MNVLSPHPRGGEKMSGFFAIRVGMYDEKFVSATSPKPSQAFWRQFEFAIFLVNALYDRARTRNHTRCTRSFSAALSQDHRHAATPRFLYGHHLEHEGLVVRCGKGLSV